MKLRWAKTYYVSKFPERQLGSEVILGGKMSESIASKTILQYQDDNLNWVDVPTVELNTEKEVRENNNNLKDFWDGIKTNHVEVKYHYEFLPMLNPFTKTIKVNRCCWCDAPISPKGNCTDNCTAHGAS